MDSSEVIGDAVSALRLAQTAALSDDVARVVLDSDILVRQSDIAVRHSDRVAACESPTRIRRIPVVDRAVIGMTATANTTTRTGSAARTITMPPWLASRYPLLSVHAARARASTRRCRLVRR